jgi:hypothetical protein
MRSAYADVPLRHDRTAETLQLLAGYESMEPLLLRVAIAHYQLHDGAVTAAEEQLSTAFNVVASRSHPPSGHAHRSALVTAVTRLTLPAIDE